MELLFELSFGLITGQTYWWWCELMGKFIGNHLGVKVGFAGEPDALLGQVMRFFAAKALNKPP